MLLHRHVKNVGMSTELKMSVYFGSRVVNMYLSLLDTSKMNIIRSITCFCYVLMIFVCVCVISLIVLKFFSLVKSVCV